MIRKSIIFTDVPLLKAFLYRERFQLVPFFYFKGAPLSKFARHFPAVLEYECEDKEEMLPMEAELLKRGLSEDVVRLGRSIPESQRVKREILHLLTALTNYHFFEYNASAGCYGVQAPMDDFKTLSPEKPRSSIIKSVIGRFRHICSLRLVNNCNNKRSRIAQDFVKRQRTL